MFRCFTCGERVPANPEQLGSRCPRCRQPLYEDPRESRPLPAQAESNRCARHEPNAAIGTCPRCGNFMCPVCRTRWRGQALCLGCVAQALESQETTPAAARTHLRQALLSVFLGGAAWVVTLGAMALILAGAMGKPNPLLIGLGVLGLLPTPLPALVGIGQAAAAIRTRGDHMILATLGLLLSCLHTGIFLGLLTFSLWQNQ